MFVFFLRLFHWYALECGENEYFDMDCGSGGCHEANCHVFFVLENQSTIYLLFQFSCKVKTCGGPGCTCKPGFKRYIDGR